MPPLKLKRLLFRVFSELSMIRCGVCVEAAGVSSFKEQGCWLVCSESYLESFEVLKWISKWTESLII